MSTDQFREIADLLFGGGGDELVHKMEPAQSDLATHDRKKRAVTAALSGIGATAGAGGLALAGKEMYHGYKSAPKALSVGRKLAHVAGTKKLAVGLLPLEAAGLGGEVMATRILHGDTKKTAPKKGSLVKKDLGDMLNNSSPPTKRSVTRAVLTSPTARKKGMEYTKKAGGTLRRLPTGATGHAKVEKTLYIDKEGMRQAYNKAVRNGTAKPNGKVRGKFVHPVPKISKADTEVEVVWQGEIAKADADKQQIFGWASVVEMNGEPVVDLQGDAITTDEMEKAGYEYVMKSRKGGDMHMRDNWSPIEKSEMIESFIVTPEKREAMGLPDSMPSGWWVGFQVRDPEVWSKVRSGERTGFSIHGKGKRTPVEP